MQLLRFAGSAMIGLGIGMQENSTEWLRRTPKTRSTFRRTEAVHGREAIREHLKAPLSHRVCGLAFDVREENFRRMERHYGAFSRSFTLASAVDAEKIEANYVHGVLAIQMPKRAEARPKQIKVNVTKALKAA
jgi:Hsp20/alpha crystallin family protein